MTRLRLTVTAVLLVLLAAVQARAATYYVSTSGSDARSCATAQTIGTPRRSITQGIACLSGGGDTLLVRAGTYDESIRNGIASGTSWANKVRIAAYPSETVWMTPSSAGYALELSATMSYIEWDGININGAASSYGAVTIQGYGTGPSGVGGAVAADPHHIRLQNFELIGDTTSINVGIYKNGILATASTSGLTGAHEFLNLTIHATTAYGIYLSAANSLVQGCNIYDTNYGGIHVSNATGYSGDDNRILGNRVHDIVHSDAFNRYFGIINGSGNNQRTLIANNLVWNIGQGQNAGNFGNGGILVYTGTDVQVINNTVWHNGIVGLGTYVGSTRSVFRNNVSYQNDSSNYYAESGAVSPTQDHNVIAADPLFMSTGSSDFRLSVGSPGIDAGVTVAAVTTDIVGVTRPQGSAYDIGAYEMSGGGGGGGSPGTITAIGHAKVAGPDTITTTGFNSTGANFLTAGVTQLIGATCTLSDSKSSTWTALTTRVGVSNQQVRIYYAKNITGGAAHTATLTGTGCYATLTFAAWSGVHTTAPFDQESGQGGTFNSPAQPGSITPSQNNALVVSAMSWEQTKVIASVTGMTILDQQDWVNNTNYGGAQAYVIQTTAAAINAAWTYTGSIEGNVAEASFLAAPQTNDVVVTVNPTSNTVVSGNTQALSVTATGSATLTYQWYVGNSGDVSAPIGGATSSTYTTPALTSSTNYWVRVTNSTGSADSTTAAQTVVTTPSITVQPISATIQSGATASLSVTAIGTATLTYQWYVGSSGSTGSPISMATLATYTTPVLTTTTSYWVRVTNTYGTADSTTATQTIIPPNGSTHVRTDGVRQCQRVRVRKNGNTCQAP